MTRRPTISSSTNDRVKRLRRLQRDARREGVFVANGYRRLERAAVGAKFELPVAVATVDETREWWPARVVVATPDGERAHWEACWEGDVAVVVGNERVGVGGGWRVAADETVRIPLPGPPDSLNVAVAAGVVLFEALRSRACAHVS